MYINSDVLAHFANLTEAHREELGRLRKFMDARGGDVRNFELSDMPGRQALSHASLTTADPFLRFVGRAVDGVHFVGLSAKEISRRFPDLDQANTRLIATALADVPRSPEI